MNKPHPRRHRISQVQAHVDAAQLCRPSSQRSSQQADGYGPGRAAVHAALSSPTRTH